MNEDWKLRQAISDISSGKVVKMCCLDKKKKHNDQSNNVRKQTRQFANEGFSLGFTFLPKT